MTRCVPPVAIANESAPGEKIPVLVSLPGSKLGADALPSGKLTLPFALIKPTTAKVESSVTAPVTSNVPGTSTLLVNSTPDPPESVCSN